MSAKPAAPTAELPTLDLADLSRVTGGAGDDLSALMPIMMMMMRNRSAGAAAAAAPPPAAVPPWQPTITVDGVPQQLTATGNGTFTTTSSG